MEEWKFENGQDERKGEIIPNFCLLSDEGPAEYTKADSKAVESSKPAETENSVSEGTDFALNLHTSHRTASTAANNPEEAVQSPLLIREPVIPIVLMYAPS